MIDVRRWIAALALLLVAASARAAAPTAEAADPAGTTADESEFPRAEMREILAAIAATLPRSLDSARFGAPETRERTLASLQALSRNASVLESHGATRGEGFRLLAAALARDAREVTRRYEAGRVDEAGFLLQRLTENCLSCHARLMSDRDSALGERLVSEMQVEGLAPPERARLEAATRQFDAALTTWEGLFRSSEMSAAQLDLMGYLGDYLTLCLRVKDDPARAQATLRAVAERPDVTDWLTHDMAAWMRALDELRAHPIQPRDASALQRARSLLQEAEAAREVPADHTGLVQDIAASGVLYRYLESSPERGREVAEAYYLLGQAESRIDRSYWLGHADLYLETAIRMAPREPFAREALALLEERNIAGWTGSSGTHIPADVQRHLDELRALVAPPAP